MTWLASIHQEHPQALPATMRERYGFPWGCLGQPQAPIAEAVTLTKAALTDTSTQLGAEHAGWEFPATVPELMHLMLQVDPKYAKMVLPFDPDDPGPRGGEQERSEDEVLVAKVQAEMEAAFTFSS